MSDFVGAWCGKDLRDMEKDELINIIVRLAKKEQETHQELLKAHTHVDWASYLLDGSH